MKNAKKKIKMLIATVAVVVVSFGATYAFLTSETAELNNTFTPSDNITVEIDEPNWDEDEDGDGHSGKEDAKNYTANQLIEKDPFLTNTSIANEHNDEYVSLELAYLLEDKNGEQHEVTYSEFTKIAKVYYEDADKNIVEGFSPAWTALSAADSENGLNDRFYYNGSEDELEILAQNAKTATIFDYVKINPELKLENTDGAINYVDLVDVNGDSFQTKGLPNFEINVKGYAVQADNISIAEAKSELLKLMKAN